LKLFLTVRFRLSWKGEEQYVIDPEKCTECGACVENIYCPAWAIATE